MGAPGSLDGNRIWRVATPTGSVLQKFYAERGGPWRAWTRELGGRVRGGKTSTLPAARRETERRLLALWREAGLDVPADLSELHPELANARTLVLEDVPGPLLSQALCDPALAQDARTELLRRFARQWCHRHRLAEQRQEAAFVQEHGALQHVIVSGARLVTFDLENAFLPRRDLGPILHKEIASYLRSLSKLVPPEQLVDDLAVIVAAYDERARLAAAARHYLDNPRLMWRVLWAYDRRRSLSTGRHRDKYAILVRLQEALLRLPP